MLADNKGFIQNVQNTTFSAEQGAIFKKKLLIV